MNYDYNAIIMSGGGTKGFCTLGALQYIQDNNIINNSNISYYIGTSVGSIISYFLAIGYTPIEIVVYLCSNNVFENIINNLSGLFNLSGVYNYSLITKHCENMTLAKIDYIPTLKQLYDNFGKKLYVCSYNLTKHKREYISYINYPNMSCLDAIRMSSNIPFIFDEFIYNGDEYIDGGIIDNFPINLVDSIENIKPIGIYLDDKEEKINLNYNDNQKILKIINKIYNIIMIPCKEKKESLIDIDVIKIGIDIQFFNFSISHTKKLELFSYGYNSAKYYFEHKILEDSIFIRDV
jgi:predicted patatin/cPLA2 family phospholipase